MEPCAPIHTPRAVVVCATFTLARTCATCGGQAGEVVGEVEAQP